MAASQHWPWQLTLPRSSTPPAFPLSMLCERSQWSADLPEAFVILGYAFYVQPMLMPLLHEMPAGQLGVQLMTTAVRYVTLGARLYWCRGLAVVLELEVSSLGFACHLSCAVQSLSLALSAHKAATAT